MEISLLMRFGGGFLILNNTIKKIINKRGASCAYVLYHEFGKFKEIKIHNQKVTKNYFKWKYYY